MSRRRIKFKFNLFQLTSFDSFFQSSGKHKKGFVPYRDSVLTWLLKVCMHVCMHIKDIDPIARFFTAHILKMK